MIQGLKVGVEIVPLAKYSMTDCYDTVELNEIFWKLKTYLLMIQIGAG